MPERKPFATVLGADGTGKSTIVTSLMKEHPITGLHKVNPAVYRQLEINGINMRPDELVDPSPELVALRRACFLGMNAGDLALTRAVTTGEAGVPMVRVRGYPDTVITHESLLGGDASFDLSVLLPEEHAPDLLVVLSADRQDIEQRVTSRGENLTGANDVEHLGRCQEAYLRLAEITNSVGIPTLVYDTSRLDHDPQTIIGEMSERMLAGYF